MTVGSVVLVPTGQAGTVVQRVAGDAVVLLASLDLWRGPVGQIWLPTSPEELAAAPREVERFEGREKRRPSRG